MHASLLPRHRGAAPVEGAILAGDAETGVTIMRIVEQMDAGPMYFQRKIPIEPTDTQGTLKEKLADLGAEAMLEAIALAARGALVETPQDEALATYTSQVEKKDAGDRLGAERRANRSDDARIRSVAGCADAIGNRRGSHLARSSRG